MHNNRHGRFMLVQRLYIKKSPDGNLPTEWFNQTFGDWDTPDRLNTPPYHGKVEKVLEHALHFDGREYHVSVRAMVWKEVGVPDLDTMYDSCRLIKIGIEHFGFQSLYREGNKTLKAHIENAYKQISGNPAPPDAEWEVIAGDLDPDTDRLPWLNVRMTKPTLR